MVDENFRDQLPDSVDPQAQKDAFTADPRITPPKVTPFLPVPPSNRWGAGDTSCVAAARRAARAWATQSINLPTPPTSRRTAVPRLSRSEQVSLTGGVGGGPGSVGGSVATGDSTGQVDYLDMNGDRFPDVVGAGGIQYTDPTGGLGGKRGTVPDGAVRKSSNEARQRQRWAAPRAPSPPAAATARHPGTPPPTPRRPATTCRRWASAATSAAAAPTARFDLLDINGDGLPDRVYADGRAALNLGYRFGAAEPWRPGALNDGSGDELRREHRLQHRLLRLRRRRFLPRGQQLDHERR